MFNKKLSLQFFSALLLLLGGSGLIIALDQFVKYKIRHLGGFYICNNGVSFSLPIFPVIFWLILSVFLLLGFIYFKHLTNNGLLSPLFLLAFVLIIGGALSNGVDRLFWGCVIDFLSIGWAFFPVFNLADVAIFIGTCLLLILIFSKNPSNGE